MGRRDICIPQAAAAAAAGGAAAGAGGCRSSSSYVCSLQMHNLYPEVTVAVKLSSSKPTLPFPDFLGVVALTSTGERFMTSSRGIKWSLSKHACLTL